MAPLRKLPAHSAQPAKSILKQSSDPTSHNSRPLFSTSKKDKRKIKHAQLMSKVTKSNTSKPRKRRPHNKLLTSLDALASALPDDADTGATAPGSNMQNQVNIIRRKSIKSRPGALKRREKLDRGERERFAKNLAQMAAAKPTADPNDRITTASTTERWAALRDFISQTLEQRTDAPGDKI